MGVEMCINAFALMMIMKSERIFLNNSGKSRKLRWRKLASVVGISMLIGSSVVAQESLIARELQKRQESVIVAQELLVEGDKAYEAHHFSDAVKAYSKAFGMLPIGPATSEIRDAAVERYAQATVENAKALNRLGQSDIAREQLQAVLQEGVAPESAIARKMLDKLDDPLRSSPTLTAEHVVNTVEVGQLLRKGESYFNQAQFDEALVSYEEVLKIDPYNQAARRGMQRVQNAKIEYYGSAYDQTRAKALEEVDASWERKVPSEIPVNFGAVPNGDEIEVQSQTASTRNKVESIIVPDINFQDLSFEEALRTIRALSRELDTTELDPESRGVNYVTRFGDELAGFSKKIKATRFSLNLRNVPMTEVLDRLTQATGTFWRAEQHAIVFRPLGSESGEMENRTFRVPVNFLREAAEEIGQNIDVFESEQGGVRSGVTALDYLKAKGIHFAEGAFAVYNKRNNTLKVRNTPEILDAVESFVRAQSLQERVQVVLHVTIMEVRENILNELGYDWLIQANANSNDAISLNAGTPADPFVTSTNRSGDTAFVGDSIENAIAGGVTTDGTQSAPGILQLTGVVGDRDVLGILRGVAQKDGSSEIQRPSIITTSGQRATFFSGNEVFFPEEYEPAEVPNNGAGIATPSTPSSFREDRVGMQLDVEATVNAERTHIDVNVVPSFRELEGFIDYGTPFLSSTINPITGLTDFAESPNSILQPIVREVSMDTSVTIQDGSTVVLGGLLQEKIEHVEDQTPILGSLPLIGRYFQTNGISREKTALVVFVKAELIDPTGQQWRQ